MISYLSDPLILLDCLRPSWSMVVQGWLDGKGGDVGVTHVKHSLFVNVFVGSISAESPLSKALSWPLARAIFGWVTDSAASGADDAVGHVGAVLALPSLVVLSSAVGASHKTCN